MKKKVLSAVAIAILLFGLSMGAACADVSNITVINDKVSSDGITVTLTNTSYEHGWFMGTVIFEDDFFVEYATSRQDVDIIMNYFSDYYTLTYMASDMSTVLPTPGGGYILNDDGTGYYYEKFKTYVALENEKQDVNIFVYGIDEPFEIMLSD